MPVPNVNPIYNLGVKNGSKYPKTKNQNQILQQKRYQMVLFLLLIPNMFFWRREGVIYTNLKSKYSFLN